MMHSKGVSWYALLLAPTGAKVSKKHFNNTNLLQPQGSTRFGVYLKEIDEEIQNGIDEILRFVWKQMFKK